MQLRDYQLKAINDINAALIEHDKIVFQLSTGGGKTVIFTHLVKSKPDYRFLILVNRDELIGQTVATLNASGITAESITSKTKELFHHAQVYVAMEQSLNNRLKKNPDFIKKIDVCIIDECHQAHFDKFVPKFTKVVGFTATPVRLERIKFYVCDNCSEQAHEEKICCETPMTEWTRPFAMSEIYETIVLGPTITELIENGFLVEEVLFVDNYADTSKLKTVNGEYTESSITEAYGTKEALFNVVKNYKAYCLGKKTMVFNGSTKSNLAVYNRFIEEGLKNVKIFDTKNSQNQNRKELVEWFKNTPDAVLCNVGVFTTGFDVKDVQAIIVNRPTQSLSLWIQIVGRGARTCTNIYKDSFVVIDGGENAARHGEWSSQSRDWKMIFEKGIGKTKPKSIALEEVKECPKCFCLVAKKTAECPECGHVFVSKRIGKPISEKVAVIARNPPKPNAKKIIEYCRANELNQGSAFKILINQILDMFIYYRVDKSLYLATRKNGKLSKKIDELYQPVYFAIIDSDLVKSGNKTMQTTKSRILTKIEQHYGIR